MFCEFCGEIHTGSYGSGRFCSQKCARGFSTNSKRKEINDKVSKTLTKERIVKICLECREQFYPYKNRESIKFCSTTCATKYRSKNPEYLKKLSEAQKERCKSLEERKRLRDIGRKGGFGKKGYTKNGVKFDSSLEEKCFNLLEELDVDYVAHKHLPNSSKVSDIYLPDLSLWIELDGINREKRKEWLDSNYKYWQEKLDVYNKNNLKHVIYKTFEEFKEGLAQLVRAPVLQTGGESKHWFESSIPQ